jgi:hypothetical protein
MNEHTFDHRLMTAILNSLTSSSKFMVNKQALNDLTERACSENNDMCSHDSSPVKTGKTGSATTNPSTERYRHAPVAFRRDGLNDAKATSWE